jgi:hypothetical protein
MEGGRAVRAPASTNAVIPAKAGISLLLKGATKKNEMPAGAGMTNGEDSHHGR